MTAGTLPERPALLRHLAAAFVGDRDVFVLSEDQAWLWQSTASKVLLPCLDGRLELADLLDHVADQVPATEALHLLAALNRLGLLGDGPAADDAAGWHALGVTDSAAIEAARQAAICVTGTNAAGTSLLADALQDAGVLVGTGDSTALVVAATRDYFDPALDQLSARSLQGGIPWMPCKLTGRTLWVGPVFRPGATGCLECLRERLRHNRQVEDYVVRKTGDPSHFHTSVAALPAAMRLAVAWAAHEVALWLGGRTDRLEGRLLAVDAGGDGLEVTAHSLTRRPQCPACGVPAGTRDPRVVLQSRRVESGADGGWRTEPAEATWARLERHVSPITGVVTWLHRQTPPDDDLLHAYSAGHNFAMGPDTVHWLRHSLRSRTGGKGASDTQARVSAVCEAIERYCGVFRGDEPRVVSTFADLGDAAVHPARCLNFSARQYEGRDAFNGDPSQGFLHLVPRPFAEDLAIEWSPLWSLVHDEARYLPTAFCYFGHPDVQRHFYCTGDANGCAAGSVMEEAVLQALLELVERDAAAIWWYNQVRRPAVDLDRCGSPFLDRLRQRYADLERELWVLDITADLGIPVFAAVSRRVGRPAEDLLIGLGAHIDPALALLRAVTELNQFLPAVSRRDTEGQTIYGWPDDTAVRFWTTETLQTQHQLAPDRDAHPLVVDMRPSPEPRDIRPAIGRCVDAAARAGLDVLVLDQSRPDIDLRVARVVVPGLRHFWRRLGPGRLYDVPVALGWLETPTAEEAMNPASIFF